MILVFFREVLLIGHLECSTSPAVQVQKKSQNPCYVKYFVPYASKTRYTGFVKIL
jgi:hypothetical protein